MRYLSLFSGIEAASVAWRPLGWTCVGVAEIERFPCAVLAHHYPGVPNLSDVSKITDADITALGQIDLIVGGFPCQDLSVAGKRKGLRDADGSYTRSGLFFEAMRLVRLAREQCGLRWLLIENVPGLYSSNAGRDFGELVAEMVGCRFDVPRDGWRNTGVAAGPNGQVEWATLDAQWFGLAQRRKRVFALADFGNWADRPPVLFIPESLRGHPAPSREAGKAVAAFTANGVGTCGADDNQAQAGHLIAHTLRGDGFDASEDGTGRGTPLVVAQPYTLAIRGRDGGHDLEYRQDGTANALLMPGGGRGGCGVGAVANATHVRRLTPRECERLQGFPDDYTNITFRGKPAADGNRYRALGNSMAVPCMAWIGKRIAAVDASL